MTLILIPNSMSFSQVAQTGLTIEVEVKPKASLSISTQNQYGDSIQGLLLNFGRLDAFGTEKRSHLLAIPKEDGMVYYHPIQITAATSGGPGYSAHLKVELLPGSSLRKGGILEDSERMVRGQNVALPLQAGQKRDVDYQVKGRKSLERMIGVWVRPQTPSGFFSAQMQYSLEVQL